MNGFHLFGFAVAMLFIIAKAKIVGQEKNYKKIILNILGAGAIIGASAAVGAIILLQSLVVKGLVCVALPLALWLAYRVQPEWFSGRENILYCIILVLFSIGVVGEGL